MKNLFLLCLIALTIQLANAQTGSFCGEFPTHTAQGTNSDSIVYDRFGNSYDIVPEIPPTGSAQGGCIETDYFIFTFDNIAPEIETVLCEVVNYMESEIDFSVNSEYLCGDLLDFEKVDIYILNDINSSPALAAASPFFSSLGARDCNQLRTNTIRQKLLTGNTRLPGHSVSFNGSNINTDGILYINKELNVFHTDSSTDPPMGSGLFDLNTVLLHEMHHFLGFFSRLNPNVNTDINIWDTKLIYDDKTINGNLLTNDCETDCYELNPILFPTITDYQNYLNEVCNPIIPNNEPSIYAPGGSVILHPDNFSHLGTDCINTSTNLVMFPFLAPEETRKTITNEELDILCNLGYNTSTCNGECHLLGNPESYDSSYENAEDPIYECCNEQLIMCVGEEYFIPYSTLYCNDFSTDPIEVSDVYVRPIHQGIVTITEQATGFLITVSEQPVTPVPVNNSFLGLRIYYTLKACDCTVIDAWSEYSVTICDDCNTDPCINLSCITDFEEFNAGNTNAAGLGGFFYMYEGTTHNTPDIMYDILNDNHFLRCAHRDFPYAQEGVAIELGKPLLPGCVLSIELNGGAEIPGQNNFLIQGSTFAPCTPFDNLAFVPTAANCPADYNCSTLDEVVCISQEELDWVSSSSGPIIDDIDLEQHLFEIDYFLPNEINFIYLSSIANRIYLDDLVITLNCANPDFTYIEISCEIVSFTTTFDIPGNTHLWDFGDGNTSTDVNPIHTYAQDGTYTVTHTVVDECGNTDFSTQIITLDCICNTDATFTVSEIQCPSYEFIPDNVNQGETHHWDFGDGSISTDVQPTHTFEPNCTYTVTHTVVDDCEDTYIYSLEVDVFCVVSVCPPLSNSYLIDGTTPVLWSELIDCEGVPTGGMTNENLNISGTVILDVNYTFLNCHFVFDPGAEMIVQSPGLIQLLGSTLEGCTEMWKGITIEGTQPSYRFQFVGNTIRDAEYALTILDGVNLYQRSNTFDKNYVGIYSPPSSLKKYYGNPVVHSNFYCTGNLLPPYSGQVNWSQISYAGIHINDMDHFIVTESPQPPNIGLRPNLFDGLRNGIIARQSNLVVIGNKIENLIDRVQTTPVSIHPSISGYAIIVDRGINVDIVGNDLSDGLNGVTLLNSNEADILIQDNDISNFQTFQTSATGHGIELFLGRNATVNITNNRILDSSFGIELQRLQRLHHLRVDNNQFTYVNNTVYSRGIVLSVVRCTNPGTVSNNILNNYGHGIQLISGRFITIANNAITAVATPTQQIATGIEAYASEQIHLRDNNVSYTGTNINFRGLDTDRGSEIVHCCNSVDGTVSAVRFLGMNTDVEFKSTLMEDSHWGLFLRDAQIGTQFHQGNTWVGGQSEARMLASDGDYIGMALASPFTVNTNRAPLSIQPTTIENLWFNKVIDDFSTTCVQSPDCGVEDYILPPNQGGNFTQLTQQECEDLYQEYFNIINGNILDGAYEDQNEWTAEYNLYELLSLYDSLRQKCFTLDSFYLNNQDLEDYYDIEYGLSEIAKLDTNQLNSLLALQASMNSNLTALLGLFENVADFDDYLYLQSSIYNLQIPVYNAVQTLNALSAVIDTQVVTEAGIINSNINGLSEPYFFNSDIKETWLVESQMINQGFSSITSLQWDSIRTISDKCPLEYGDAVYNAICLLNLIEEVKQINFDSTCQYVPPRSVKHTGNDNTALTQFSLYPNPTASQITIRRKGSLEESLYIEIFNIEGRSLQSYAMIKDKNEVIIDVSALLPGIYMTEIRSKDKTLERLRFIKE